MGEIELGWGDFGGEAAAWGVQAPVLLFSLIGRCLARGVCGCSSLPKTRVSRGVGETWGDQGQREA